jgi:hypothetical protein
VSAAAAGKLRSWIPLVLWITKAPFSGRAELTPRGGGSTKGLGELVAEDIADEE